MDPENRRGQADGTETPGEPWTWGSSRGSAAMLQLTDIPMVVGAPAAVKW